MRISNSFFAFFIAIFLCACVQNAQPSATISAPAQLAQKQFIVTNEAGAKSRILLSQIAQNEYKFVWLDMLGAPISRKILTLDNGKAKFRNDGFMPPAKFSEKVFLEILNNVNKRIFTITAKGKKYEIKSL